MTIYELSIISSTGFPYYNKKIKPVPKGVQVHLRFFDFSEQAEKDFEDESYLEFDLKAGLISALFEFARNIDKKIEVLEFRPKAEEEINQRPVRERIKYKGDVLMTVTTEKYLHHDQIRRKIELIYENFISPKIPLDSAYEVLHNEENSLLDILTDKKAKNHLSRYEKTLKKIAKKYIDEMNRYGLKGIVCCGFDLSPIICFSEHNQYHLEDIDEILRGVGNIPEIEALNWKYRQSTYNNKPLWVFIINSGIGVSVEGLYENYYYLLLTEPDAYMGEFPRKLANEFNNILTEDI
jgi:hypothetical protein